MHRDPSGSGNFAPFPSSRRHGSFHQSRKEALPSARKAPSSIGPRAIPIPPSSPAEDSPGLPSAASKLPNADSPFSLGKATARFPSLVNQDSMDWSHLPDATS